MGLPDFVKQAQEKIQQSLPEAKIDQATIDKIMSLVPEDLVSKIPSVVRNHAITKTIEKVASEHPDLYKKFTENGPVSEETRTKMAEAVRNIFSQKMDKHHMN